MIITTREYNPSDGSMINNINSLNFGNVMAGTRTPVKVIDFAFSGFSSISNLKIGIISSSVDLESSEAEKEVDGSVESGRYGIMHTDYFVKSIASAPLAYYFAGINETNTAEDPNNISIGMRNEFISQFIYLDMVMSPNDLGSISGSYKIFFDFE